MDITMATAIAGIAVVIIVAAILVMSRISGGGPSRSYTIISDTLRRPFSDQWPEREAYIRENITAIAENQFPDNTGIEWKILGMGSADHLTYVEVEPNPDEVGYSKFKLLIDFKDPNAPGVIATYCLEDGAYSLLSHAPGYSAKHLETPPA